MKLYNKPKIEANCGISLFTYCWLSVVVQLIIASKSQSPRIQKKMAAYLHSYFLAEVRRKNKIDR
jgi:hypothetical protein